MPPTGLWRFRLWVTQRGRPYGFPVVGCYRTGSRNSTSHAEVSTTHQPTHRTGNVRGMVWRHPAAENLQPPVERYGRWSIRCYRRTGVPTMPRKSRARCSSFWSLRAPGGKKTAQVGWLLTSQQSRRKPGGNLTHGCGIGSGDDQRASFRQRRLDCVAPEIDVALERLSSPSGTRLARVLQP
jgi:hypothetical protein